MIRVLRVARRSAMRAKIAATKLALKKLARRYLELVDAIAELDRHLEPLVTRTAPKLVAQLGIGVQSAAQLLVTAGDNPERLQSAGRSRTCAASLRCPPRRANASTDIGSTSAATATPTARFT
jgi:hypothetical protein